MLKLVKWAAQDSASLFGAMTNPGDVNSGAIFEAKNIVPIAHTQDASEYVGISFEVVNPLECTEITLIEENKYYFFHSPKDGHWLTLDLANLAIKQLRQTELDKLKISINDNIFDADEISQNRMTRAITAMSQIDTIMWRLNDNKFIEISKEALQGVLLRAGQAQTALWLKYSL